MAPAPSATIWQRYGQLRVYVSAGERYLGWYDPRSGRYDLADPGDADAFWPVVHAECQRLRREGRLSGQAPADSPPAGTGTADGQPLGTGTTDSPPAADSPLTRAETSSGPSANGETGDPARTRAAAAALAAERAAAADGARRRAGPARDDTDPGESPGTDSGDGGGHWVVRDPAWDDLARNSPGASAQARARELRAAHPVWHAAARMAGVRTSAQSFAFGARGERLVGRKLNRWARSRGWCVLHAVPVGRSGADIDHVIIAPFGVVTVNTKRTAHRVWVGEYGMTVGGQAMDYLRKSRAEARRAMRLLSGAAGFGVPVQAVIVFTGTRRFAVRRGGPADVAVLPTPAALRRWLRKQPAALTAAQADLVYQVARRPGTWQG